MPSHLEAGNIMEVVAGIETQMFDKVMAENANRPISAL